MYWKTQYRLYGVQGSWTAWKTPGKYVDQWTTVRYATLYVFVNLILKGLWIQKVIK